MVLNRVDVPADQRWPRVLGRVGALLAALACASFFVNTARADDPAPSDGSGTPTSAVAPAPDTDTSPTEGDAPDTDSVVTPSDPTSAGADAGTTTVAPGSDPAAGCSPAPSDPTSTGADASTTVAPGSDPEAAGCASAPSDATSNGADATATAVAPGTAAKDPGCASAPSDSTSTGTDATATTAAPGTAAEAPERTDAIDTCASSGAVPAAAPVFSTAQASASNKRYPKRRCGSGAANGRTDSVPPPSAPAPADDGSSAPDNSETLSGLVHGASAGSTASSAAPEVADDPTTTDSPLSRSFLDLSTEASGLGSRTVSPSALMVNVGVGSFFRPQVDHRVVACKSAVSASVRFASERIVLARLPAHLDTSQAARSGVTGEKKGHPNGSRKLGSLVPPAPDNDKAPLPPAPSSSLGSGGSGGIQGKGVYGVVTARLSLVPPRVGRPVTLVEKRRRALRLFFILERPG